MIDRLHAVASAITLPFCLLIYSLAANVRAEVSAATQATPVTFYRDVAPIVYRSCASCHREGGAGPFSLLTYDDVRKHAPQIASVTKRRYMPPWLPEPGYGHFEREQERRLTDEQIGVIEQWVRQGTPAGSPADAPPMPKFVPGWQLGKPDMVIEAPVAYHLPAEGPDQYWNFVLPLRLPGPRWVKAIEIHPGNVRVVHHANVYIDARIDSSRAASSADKIRAGFPGMDMTAAAPLIFDSDSDSYFLYWKPGETVSVQPPGMAWRANPGTNLLLNVHMRTTGRTETVQPSIELYFTNDPGTIHPAMLELEHDGALDIPAGNPNFKVGDDFVTPVDLDVLAIYPHAHYLGHVLEGYATLPGGARKSLIRIPNWDQSWQAVYRYAAPVFLPKGTVISMRYSYDNSAANVRNPHQPPQRVRDGNQTTDEMAHLSLQVLPHGPQDSRMQLQEAVMHHRLEKYPGDFLAQFNLGVYMLGQNRSADAVRYLRGAVAAQPNQPVALNELGTALLAQNDANGAAGFFERALQVNPHDADAGAGLTKAFILQHNWDAAALELRKSLADRPSDAQAQQQLGTVLMLLGYTRAMNGKLEEAVGFLRESLSFRPNDAELHNNLGELLAHLGRTPEAVHEYETALSLNPKLERARHNLEAARGRF